MRTVAVTMVRDEVDIIGRTLGHMLDEVDAVVVADNLSTDGTRELLDEMATAHPERLVVVDDPDPRYLQSAKMTDLARRARLQFGAEMIVPFDADEWWYSPFGRIADVLADVRPQWLIVPAPLFDHVATAEDPLEGDPVARMGFRRREPNPLPKVACRWREDMTIAQGNHDAHYIGRGTRFDQLLVVRHFPYRSVAQLVRKVRNGAAAYRAAGDELPPFMGAHWRQWGDLLDQRGEEAIAEIFHGWYWRDRPRADDYDPAGEARSALIFDPAPGQ